MIKYINTDFIKLGQLLKLSGIADTGSTAKLMIQDGLILLNEKLETRRGKKVFPGDKVTVNLSDEIIIINIKKEKKP